MRLPADPGSDRGPEQCHDAGSRRADGCSPQCAAAHPAEPPGGAGGPGGKEQRLL
ncbi:hypothetical protein INF35_09220 [Subdoligranulum sp. DSM 109015]|uniref:Uncharacterized protein n=1 Tax=Gemmiger gallinarum TaxID=2779354 RepID=A0ABR9R4C5_9FIRM|nr:hypothetical protein [Gemmiger gallinarum]